MGPASRIELSVEFEAYVGRDLLQAEVHAVSFKVLVVAGIGALELSGPVIISRGLDFKHECCEVGQG